LVGVAWSAWVSRGLSQSEGKVNLPTNYPVLVFYFLYAGAFLWLLVG
jgi:hypothetical protein